MDWMRREAGEGRGEEVGGVGVCVVSGVNCCTFGVSVVLEGDLKSKICVAGNVEPPMALLQRVRRRRARYSQVDHMVSSLPLVSSFLFHLLLIRSHKSVHGLIVCF